MNKFYTIVENISAYFECLYRNRYTRLTLVMFGVSILYFYLGLYYLGFLLLLISITFFTLLEGGYPSYYVYKRALKHMIQYKSEVESNAYCGNVGCWVATRRFKKKYPEEYKEMMDKRDPIVELLKSLLKDLENF